MALAKETWMAIFISAIMVMSVGGFALSRMMRLDNNNPDVPVIPPILNRELTKEETLFLLRSGKVIINSHYYSDCMECKEKTTEIEFFVRQYTAYLTLSKVELPANETKSGFENFEMIGSNGRIKELEGEVINEQNLLTLFCTYSAYQPPDCLLDEY